MWCDCRHGHRPPRGFGSTWQPRSIFLVHPPSWALRGGPRSVSNSTQSWNVCLALSWFPCFSSRNGSREKVTSSTPPVPVHTPVFIQTWSHCSPSVSVARRSPSFLWKTGCRPFSSIQGPFFIYPLLSYIVYFFLSMGSFPSAQKHAELPPTNKRKKNTKN